MKEFESYIKPHKISLVPVFIILVVFGLFAVGKESHSATLAPYFVLGIVVVVSFLIRQNKTKKIDDTFDENTKNALEEDYKNTQAISQHIRIGDNALFFRGMGEIIYKKDICSMQIRHNVHSTPRGYILYIKTNHGNIHRYISNDQTTMHQFKFELQNKKYV